MTQADPDHDPGWAKCAGPSPARPPDDLNTGSLPALTSRLKPVEASAAGDPLTPDWYDGRRPYQEKPRVSYVKICCV